jgi:type 1 glutamine amidotransferase
VRRRGAGHGQRVRLVFQAVLGFVLDGVVGRLLLHAWLETAALDHETVDHAVEDGVGVVAGFHVFQEVGDRFRRFLVVQFDGHVAHVGGDDYVGHCMVLM